MSQRKTDQDLLDQIENLLATGDPSDDALLDNLATNRPQARADFQKQLEDQLLDKLQQQQATSQSGESIMPITIDNKSKNKRKQRPQRRRVLTFAAAVLALVIAGGLLFMTRDTGYRFASVDDVPGQVPNPVSVVFAVENIPVNNVILPNMIRIETVMLDDVNREGDGAFFVDVRAVVGRRVISEIPEGAIIRASMLAESVPVQMTATPISTLDPFRLTATALVEQATQTIQAQFGTNQLDGRPTAINIDPFSATATAIVVDVTAQAIRTNAAGASAGCLTAQGLEEEYIVAEGDTLFSIAENFETTIEILVRENCLDSADLFVGQPLRVPYIEPASQQQQTQAAVLEDLQRTSEALTRSAISPTPVPTNTLTPSVILTATP